MQQNFCRISIKLVTSHQGCCSKEGKNIRGGVQRGIWGSSLTPWKDEGQIIFSSANYWLNCVSLTKRTAQTRFQHRPKLINTMQPFIQLYHMAIVPLPLPPCYLPNKLHACPLRTYRLGPTLRQCSIRVHFRSGTHTRWYNPLHLQKRRSIQQPDKMWPEKYVQFLACS